MITVTLISVLKDNYSYLLEDDSGVVGVVDPGQPTPIEHVLKEKGLNRLDVIFNTHHHSDHVAGNVGLRKIYRSKIAAPARDAHRISDIDIPLQEGENFQFGSSTMKVLDIPGHTSGHIGLWFPQDKMLFCGDTLFSLGCGRVFEGTPEQLFESLQKIKTLPDDTKIYCGHEYTQENGAFCQTIDPHNATLKARMDEVRKLRANGQPTLPAILGEEKKANIFLKAGSAQEFAGYRSRKDTF